MTNEPPYQILLNKKSKIAKKNSIFKKLQLDKNKTSTTNLNRELFLTRSFNRPNALGFMQNPPGFKELKNLSEL